MFALRAQRCNGDRRAAPPERRLSGELSRSRAMPPRPLLTPFSADKMKNIAEKDVVVCAPSAGDAQAGSVLTV